MSGRNEMTSPTHTLKTPLNEITCILALFYILFEFLFEILAALRPVRRMLGSVRPYGNNPKSKDDGNHAVDCSDTELMLECFQWCACAKERSWVSIQMKDLLRIILHFTAFCIAFYCQLDLQ